MDKKTEALKLALAVLKEWRKGFPDDWTDFDTEAVTAIREALAEQPAPVAEPRKQEPVDWEAVAADQALTIALLKSEQPAQQEPVAWLIAYEVCCGRKNRGSSLKKFDEVWAKCSFVSEDKDAEINASKWRNRKETPLYTSPPASKPDFKAFKEWAEAAGYDTAYTYDTDRSRWLCLNPMTADLWKAWQAANGIKEKNA